MTRGRGRPFNQSTPLGQILWKRGYTLKRIEAATGIGHRKMSDYLAGREPISPKHMALLSAELDLPREAILGQQRDTKDLSHAGKLDTGKLVAGMVAAMREAG